MINYRLRGLAADFHKTQNTMLVNKSKARVRSERESIWIYVQVLNRSRGVIDKIYKTQE